MGLLRTGVIAASFVLAGLAVPAAAQSDFDEASDTAGWTVDRYAPEGFESGVSFDSRLVLEHSIGPDGEAANRPAGYSSAFYDTQGMKSPLFAPGTTTMSIELYVPDAWSTTGDRMAGFWGEGLDDISSLVSYPILEYASGAGWRGWDGAGWLDLGGAVNYDGWNTLGIALNGTSWDYSVNGSVLGSVDANGATSLGRAILQGHNVGGEPYAIRWDNLSTPAVPEPGTWAMMFLGFAAIGFAMRRRKSARELTQLA